MQRAPYIHLYVDNDGESHFADKEIELIPTDFAPPAAPLNIAKFFPTTQSIWVGAAPNWAGDAPHPTPQRQIFCTMAGCYEVTASDGDVRSLPSGAVLLLDDTWGKGHSTRVTSLEEVLIFGVVLADA